VERVVEGEVEVKGDERGVGSLGFRVKGLGFRV
jgi:hypothetical protein